MVGDVILAPSLNFVAKVQELDLERSIHRLTFATRGAN